MKQSSTGDTAEPLKSASRLDRLSARILFAVTPEYADVQAARGSGYGPKPTLNDPPSMPFNHKEISGVRIRYAHQASSDKPTLILLNPLPQSILAFAPVWDHLAANFNLYAYDLPGFGRSEGGEEFMTFEAQGRFLRDFISEFDIRTPHIVGPDIGMAAALAYVANFPNEVSSLAIGDGPGVVPSQNGSIIDKMVDSGFWRLIFRIAGAGTFVHAANELCYLNYVPNAHEISDYIYSYSGRIDQVNLWFRKYPESLRYVDSKLADIDTPVLIFWGAQDKLLLAENAGQLSERLPRSRTHVFENCGHFSYQDQYETFRDVIAEWAGGGYRLV